MCADHLEDLFIQCQETSSFTVPSQDHCHHDSLFRSVSCVKFVLKRELSRSNSPFRSWARGLGIATLTMHHGTVFGDGLFVCVPCNSPKLHCQPRYYQVSSATLEWPIAVDGYSLEENLSNLRNTVHQAGK